MISYEYNESGIRTKKTMDDIVIEYLLDGTQIIGEKHDDGTLIIYLYDDTGVSGIVVKSGATEYFYTFEKNLQGDIIAIYNESLVKIVDYTYDAWGNFEVSLSSTSTMWEDTVSQWYNPFRYRGYYWDFETGNYYLQTRYYNPDWGRFISSDNQLSMDNLYGCNLFSYCGNNPVNRIDPTGEAWEHWILGAAIVAGCAIATLITCGGFAAAATSVWLVANGVAAATTASTVAAGALIGSATAFGMAVLTAAMCSNSFEEFGEQGNWFTVLATAGGAFSGGTSGYAIYNSNTPSNKKVPNPYGKKGGPAHQAEIEKQMSIAKSQGYSVVNTEVRIPTPGGMKPYRYADFSAMNPSTGEIWYGNVGRQLASGLPCARERYAISDIEGTGRTIRFFPYN